MLNDKRITEIGLYTSILIVITITAIKPRYNVYSQGKLPKIEKIYQEEKSSKLNIREKKINIFKKDNKKEIKIGKKKGNKSKIFGEVEDVTRIKSGEDRFAVLDGRYNRVKIYNLKGELVSAFGKPGSGPSEFKAPIDIAIDKNNNIYVLDKRSIIKMFKKKKGKYKISETYSIGYISEEICILKDKIVIQGLNQSADGSMLHVYNKDFNKINSFGDVYNSENQVARFMLSKGEIGCNEKENNVIFSSSYLPYIYSYNMEGELQWVRLIDDWVYRPLQEEKRGGSLGVRQMGSNSKFDIISDIHAINNSIVVSVKRHNPNQKQETWSNRSYVLDAESGDLELRLRTSGVLEHYDESSLLSNNLPYPFVTIIRPIK